MVQFSQEIIMTRIVNEPLEESAQQPLEESPQETCRPSSQETRRRNNNKSWLKIYGSSTLSWTEAEDEEFWREYSSVQ
jgi:hypothetical protein